VPLTPLTQIALNDPSMFATPNNNKDTPYQLPSNSFLQHLNRPPPDDSPTVVRTTLADDNHNKKPQMTLKEQERAIDKLTKDNFNLKLKISFLEERMVNNSPENMEQVFKENVENKVKIQQLEVELDRRQKLLVETKMLIDHLQMQAMAAQRQKGGELDADAHKELMHLRKEVAQLRQANAWSDIHERELVYQQRDEAEARLDEAQQEFALLEAKVGELDAENGALHDELQDAKDLASRAEQLQNVQHPPLSEVCSKTHICATKWPSIN
jgi:chromosome segregation ATPase